MLIPVFKAAESFALLQLPVQQFFQLLIHSGPMAIAKAVLFCDFSHDPAGIAGGYTISGNGPGHNTPCTDHGILTDFHPGQNNHAGTNPAVFSNADGFRVLPESVAESGINRVTAADQRYVGANLHAVFNHDGSVIHHGEIEIDVNRVPDVAEPAGPVGVDLFS